MTFMLSSPTYHHRLSFDTNLVLLLIQKLYNVPTYNNRIPVEHVVLVPSQYIPTNQIRKYGMDIESIVQ